MDRQTQYDICTVLNALINTATPAALEAIAEDGGETDQQIHDAMVRLGDLVGMDAGIL